MKFGKEFTTHLEETLPEWRDKFLCYKPLKKLLKRHFPSPTTPDINLHPNTDTDGLDNQAPLLDLQEWFIWILNEELDKFNDFYVNKEEEFVIRFQVRLLLLHTIQPCDFNGWFEICKCLYQLLSVCLTVLNGNLDLQVFFFFFFNRLECWIVQVCRKLETLLRWKARNLNYALLDTVWANWNLQTLRESKGFIISWTGID